MQNMNSEIFRKQYRLVTYVPIYQTETETETWMYKKDVQRNGYERINSI